MARTVYRETWIISYLVARPSRDLVTAARQQLTPKWWGQRRALFEVLLSGAVIADARAGDAAAAGGWRAARSADRVAEGERLRSGTTQEHLDEIAEDHIHEDLQVCR